MAFGKESIKQKQRADEVSLWARNIHPLAFASLALGIITLIDSVIVALSYITGPLAIILGFIALKKSNTAQNTPDSIAKNSTKKFAILGITLGTLGIISATIIYYYIIKQNT